MFTRFSKFDPCWPLMTFDLLHTIWDLSKLPFLRYRVYKAFTMFSQYDPCWPLTSTKNNRLLVLNVALLHTKYEICPSFPSWDIVLTRLLQCFHNMTPLDPWPPPKTIGFLYSMWHSYIPNMRSVQGSLLEISCLQGFHNLTRWPLMTFDLHQNQ